MTESWSEARRIRAGDADRDAVVAALQRHHEAGRLTAEEFQERMAAALAATWLDELPPLMADLPGEPRESSGPTGERDQHEHPPGPPWGPRWGPPPRGGRPPWPVWPLLPLIVVALIVAGSIAAIAHGHFPFPLIWLAVFAFLWRPWWARRAWGRSRR